MTDHQHFNTLKN